MISFTIFGQKILQEKKSHSSPTYPLSRLEDGDLLAKKDKKVTDNPKANIKILLFPNLSPKNPPIGRIQSINTVTLPTSFETNNNFNGIIYEQKLADS